MAKDNLISTGRRGVFYIEHPTRKYSVGIRTLKDRQYVLRYTINGVTRKEVFGWASEGKTLPDAEKKIQELKTNAKLNLGPVSLAEERTLVVQQQEEAEKQAREEQARNITFDEYFNSDYLSAARAEKKPRTVSSEVSLYEKWVKPVVGDVPIREIVDWHFDKLKQRLIKAKKSPRTIHYCVSIITQVWNKAFDNKLVDTRPPRRKTLRLPMVDNEKTKAFTVEQAGQYLEKLGSISEQWHDISLVSLLTGLRASEVFRLEVKDFDKKRKLLFLRQPKKNRSQTLVLNDSAIELFERLIDMHPTESGLIFTSTKGEQITEVSDSVERTIEALGFNEGVTDRRDRLTFHSLRHTYATWLLDSGTDIYTISQLLRHSSLAMTKRYVHPHEERLRAATKAIDKAIKGGE